MITFLILTRGRKAWLAECLDRLGTGPFEILVALNGADPETEAFLKTRAGVRAMTLPPSTKGKARDLAMKEAKGEILYFLDDDVLPPAGFPVSVEAAFAAHPEAGVIGGPNLTPRGAPAFERAQGILLASKLGAAGMSRRYRDGLSGAADESSLILCNLGIRRAAFEDLSFEDGLASGEENLLMWRLAKRGVAMRFEPSLALEHRRRGTLGAFVRQVFRSGLGRMQGAWREPGSLRAVHVLPAIGLFLFPLYPLYLAAVVLAAFVYREAWLLVLYPAAHGAYALGFLCGLLTPDEPHVH